MHRNKSVHISENLHLKSGVYQQRQVMQTGQRDGAQSVSYTQVMAGTCDPLLSPLFCLQLFA